MARLQLAGKDLAQGTEADEGNPTGDSAFLGHRPSPVLDACLSMPGSEKQATFGEHLAGQRPLLFGEAKQGTPDGAADLPEQFLPVLRVGLRRSGGTTLAEGLTCRLEAVANGTRLGMAPFEG
jgi:hypothetical protein